MSLRHRFQFAATVHGVKGTANRSVDQIRALQDQRLRSLLRHAVENSPFYRERFSGIDIATARLTDLPPVTKSELRDRWDDVVTDRTLKLADLEAYVRNDDNLGRWYRGLYAVCHTSGSQGRPLVIVQNRHCISVIFALLAARCSLDGPPSIFEAIRRLIQPKRVAAISFRRGPYPSGMLVEFMPEILGKFAKIQRFSSIDPDLIKNLEAFNPDSITGYSSVLEAISMSGHALQLPRLKQLTNSSEKVSARAKERIERAFGAPILDHYGTGECLQLADGCPHCGHLHVNDDWAILESVDENNVPVPAGVVGEKILVTNLANHTQPFIRYEVADRVSLSPELCQHRQMTRIATMEGRSVEVFWVGAGAQRRFLPGILFHSALDAIGMVQEWQAVQRSSDSILLRLLPVPAHRGNVPELERRARESLLRTGLPDWIRLTLEVVPELLPNSRTGKMQRILVELDGNSGQSPSAVA